MTLLGAGGAQIGRKTGWGLRKQRRRGGNRGRGECRKGHQGKRAPAREPHIT